MTAPGEVQAKRYSLLCGAVAETRDTEGNPSGEYVKSMDYDKLRTELAALRHDLERHIAIAAEVLSTDELRFLECVLLQPGSKLNDGEAYGNAHLSADGYETPLWPKLESLGLLACVGGYKWAIPSSMRKRVFAVLSTEPSNAVPTLPAAQEKAAE